MLTYTNIPTVTARVTSPAPSTVVEALKNRSAVSAIAVHITTSGPPVDYYWSTASLRRFSHAEADKYTPALSRFGAIVTEGAPGVQTARTDVSFTVANKVLGMYGAPPSDVTDELYDAHWEGADIVVRAFVERPNGEWETIVIYKGLISKVDVTPLEIEFRASSGDVESLQIPTEVIDASSMLFDVEAEGVVPDGSFGDVAPLAYGRHGIQAIDSKYDAADSPWGENRGYVLAPALGIKVPMVPVSILADLHHHKNGISAFNEGRHVLFSLGSAAAGVGGALAIPLPWWQEDEFSAVGYTRGLEADGGGAGNDPLFPNEHTALPPDSGEDTFKWGFLFTWNGQVGVAMPYCKDMSSDQKTGTFFSGEHAYASLWDYYQVRGVGQHTSATGPGSRHHVWALERIDPEWSEIASGEPGYWTGLCQSIAVVGDRPSQTHGTTGIYTYNTTPGVLSPHRAFDGKPDTFAIILPGQQLSVQLVAEIPSQGEAIALRVGVITGGTTTLMRMAARPTPSGPFTMNTREEWNIGSETADYVQHNPQVMPFATFYLWDRNSVTSAFEPGRQRKPTWTIAEIALGQNNAFATDVLLFPLDGFAYVYAIWAEMIYRPRIGDPVDRAGGRETQPITFTGRQVGVVGHSGDIFFGNRDPSRRSFGSSNIVDTREARVPQTYATGVWGLDETGRYLGPVNKPLDNPASDALHAIDYFLGEYGNTEIGINAFGSLRDAFDQLEALIAPDNWRVAISQTNRIPFQRFMDEIARHCMGLVQRQVNQVTASHIWRMFVDTPTPPAERMWRSDDEITPNDVVGDQIRVPRGLRSAVRNRFVLRYGYHIPSGTYAHEHTCSRYATTLTGAEANDYVQACQDSVSTFGMEQDVPIELPWLWQHAAAEEALKWHIDSLRQPRVSIQMTCNHNLLDIEIGNYVRLSDDFAAHIGSYPGFVTEDGAAWSGHKFAVVRKTVRYEADHIMVDLLLLERWAKPVVV